MSKLLRMQQRIVVLEKAAYSVKKEEEYTELTGLTQEEADLLDMAALIINKIEAKFGRWTRTNPPDDVLDEFLSPEDVEIMDKAASLLNRLRPTPRKEPAPTYGGEKV